MNRNAIAIARTRWGFATSAPGTSGSRLRRSIITKAASSEAPTSPPPTIADDPQPSVGPWTSAKTTSVTPPVTLRAPGKSKLRVPAWGCAGGISANASARASAANGTLTKNTARHPRPCVRTPPSRTPTTSPAAPAPPHAASARLRARPSANVVLSSESVAGNTSAPPSPCTLRAASWTSALVARPPGSEPPADSARPVAGGERALGARGQPAGQRAAGVQRQARDEDTTTADDVGGAAAQQQEAGGGNRVGTDDCLQRLGRVAQVAADLRQRDDDDVLVQRDDQHREGQQGEDRGLTPGATEARGERHHAH